MSQIKRTPITMIVALIGLMVLSACSSSTPNQKAGDTYNSEKGSHAEDWLPKQHSLSAKENQNVCKECHGEELNGGIAGVSCTLCHMESPEAIHPLDWQDTTAVPRGVVKHRWYVMQNGTERCASQYCHGADLGGVAASGIDCKSCHTFVIPKSDNCTACHGFPPASGKHSQHVSLQDADCSVCHFTNHADVTGTSHPGANPLLRFQTSYAAKSGTTASFNSAANTCSTVSCHGGQTTPGWQSGAFDVNTQCASCHAFGTAEYNSYSSGQHDYHVNNLHKACTTCHDTGKLAVNHFTSLSTSAMEGPAAATINDAFNYAAGSCTPSCHATRNW